jgi:hypothetical protein
MTATPWRRSAIEQLVGNEIARLHSAGVSAHARETV